MTEEEVGSVTASPAAAPGAVVPPAAAPDADKKGGREGRAAKVAARRAAAKAKCAILFQTYKQFSSFFDQDDHIFLSHRHIGV